MNYVNIIAIYHRIRILNKWNRHVPYRANISDLIEINFKRIDPTEERGALPQIIEIAR